MPIDPVKAANDLDAVADMIISLAAVLPVPVATKAVMVAAGEAVKGITKLMRYHGLSAEEILSRMEPAIPAIRPWPAKE